MPTRKKELPKNVINPFSDEFLKEWDLWKQYKMEEFKFKYKGVISEQAALMQLATLSEGKEDVAVLIIRQSMSNGWKGLFQKKQNKNNKPEIDNYERARLMVEKKYSGGSNAGE